VPAPKDDKQLLLDDEARAAAAPGGAPVVNVNVTPGLADQLNKPFMPSITGDMSIASVGILFFALVIISAILWRTWANKQSQEFAERLQAEQTQVSEYLRSQTPEATAVQSAIQTQMSNLPAPGATAAR
jgi:hypothetical protein